MAIDYHLFLSCCNYSLTSKIMKISTIFIVTDPKVKVYCCYFVILFVRHYFSCYAIFQLNYVEIATLLVVPDVKATILIF